MPTCKEDLFQRYQTELARWPEVIEGEEEIRFQIERAGLGILDWLGGFRCNAEGGRGRVVLETSDLVDKERHYRIDKLIRHWVTHLVAHLAPGEKPLTTMVVSKKGSIELSPLEIHVAKDHLHTLLSVWQQGMCRPLPLAVKTALVWLKTNDAQKTRSAYEGGFSKGEVDHCAYLQRAYPNFEALVADGTFYELAHTLLHPLQHALLPRGKKSAGAAA
ncbi:hypothetical protein CCP4SC76_5370003 [Gammaproteobacteria bacterium]